MTAIHIRKQWVQQAGIIGTYLFALALGLTAVWIIWSTSGAPTDRERVAVAQSGSRSDEPMTASASLLNDKGTILVFRPVEKCMIQYCLNANAVAAQLPAELANQFDVVDVPVYAAAAEAHEGPPAALRVDWDLYPALPYWDMIPAPVLTDFGWSIRDTTMILVSSDGQQSATLHSALDLAEFDSFLLELPGT